MANLDNIQTLRDYLDEVRPADFDMDSYNTCICGYAHRAIASEIVDVRQGREFVTQNRGRQILGIDEDEAYRLFIERRGLDEDAEVMSIVTVDDAIGALDWILGDR